VSRASLRRPPWAVPHARVGSGGGTAAAAAARRTGGDPTRGVRGGRATGWRWCFPFSFFSRRAHSSSRTARDARAPPPASARPCWEPCARQAVGVGLTWSLVAPATSPGFAAASTAAAASAAARALKGDGGGGGGASTSAAGAAAAAAPFGKFGGGGGGGGGERAKRRLHGTKVGVARAVGCRLRSASVRPPAVRAWATGTRGEQKETELPSGGSEVSTHRAQGGGPQPVAAVRSAVRAPATAGAAPAAAAWAPPQPFAVAIVNASTIPTRSVAGAPEPVGAAAGVVVQVDAAVAPVDSAAVDAAAGAAAAATGGVVDTVAVTAAAATAAAAGPPPPPPSFGHWHGTAWVARVPADARARRRGRPGRRDA